MIPEYRLWITFPFLLIGITWAQELVWLVCNNGDIDKARSVPLDSRVVYIEYKEGGIITGLEMVLFLSVFAF